MHNYSVSIVDIGPITDLNMVGMTPWWGQITAHDNGDECHEAGMGRETKGRGRAMVRFC